VNDISEIKSKNVMIQVNASTIMGRSGFKQKSKVMKLIKANLVDFVASDIHSRRNNYMLKAYNVVKKKFGEDVAEKLFNLNAKSLINVDGD
jgi:protein-tyrosine phosphatase